MSMNKADHLYDYIVDGIYRSDIGQEFIIAAIKQLYELAEPEAERLRIEEKQLRKFGDTTL